MYVLQSPAFPCGHPGAAGVGEMTCAQQCRSSCTTRMGHSTCRRVTCTAGAHWRSLWSSFRRCTASACSSSHWCRRGPSCPSSCSRCAVPYTMHVVTCSTRFTPGAHLRALCTTLIQPSNPIPMSAQRRRRMMNLLHTRCRLRHATGLQFKQACIPCPCHCCYLRYLCLAAGW